jgi:MFS family permease
MRTAGSYRGVLAVRDARSLIIASAASQFGNWLFNAALLAYVYEATHSAGWVGAATICRLLPYVLLGPVGGMIADRYDRRTVLVVGDAIRCVTMLGLAAVVAANGPVIAVIAITAAASAAGTAERPAAIALLPRLVGEARLGPANALLHTAQDVGVVTGPAVGAILLAVSSDWAAFVANAVTFAASATLIATMRTRGTPQATGQYRESVGSQLSHGMRTARMTPYVVPLMIVVAMAELTYGAQTVQLVLYAEQRLDVGADGYGYLLAAVGFGGLLSTVFNGRLAASTRVSIIVVLAGLAFCLTQLVYAGVDLLAVALIATVIGGAGFVACEVVAETAVARVVAADVLGRVMGVFDAVSVASMVGGAAIASVLVTTTSLRTSLLTLGVATVVVTIGCRRALRGLDALSERRAEVLETRLAVIERLPIAEGAPRVALEQLASAAQVCPLPEGVDVVVQGAPAHAFYAVIDGEVIVHRDGKEVARLGPGDYFGERGLLDNAPRNASVTTAEPSTVLRLEGIVLLDVLSSAPTMRTAIDRSREQTALVDDVAWRQS